MINIVLYYDNIELGKAMPQYLKLRDGNVEEGNFPNVLHQIYESIEGTFVISWKIALDELSFRCKEMGLVHTNYHILDVEITYDIAKEGEMRWSEAEEEKVAKDIWDAVNAELISMGFVPSETAVKVSLIPILAKVRSHSYRTRPAAL